MVLVTETLTTDLILELEGSMVEEHVKCVFILQLL